MECEIYIGYGIRNVKKEYGVLNVYRTWNKKCMWSKKYGTNTYMDRYM